MAFVFFVTFVVSSSLYSSMSNDEAAERAARLAALRLLAGRDYGAAQLVRRLIQRGHERAVAEAAVARLTREHLQSDARYAESLLRQRMRRGESPKVAAMHGRQQGVESEALAAAVEQAEAHYDAETACRELIGRRDPAEHYRRDERAWRRLARHLQSKGFELGLIFRILGRQPRTNDHGLSEE